MLPGYLERKAAVVLQNLKSSALPFFISGNCSVNLNLWAAFSDFCSPGKAGSGKYLILQQLAGVNGLTLHTLECTLMVGESSAATEARIRQKLNLAIDNGMPRLIVLRNVDILGKNREGKLDHRVLDFLEKEIGRIASSTCFVLGDCVDECECERAIAAIFDGGHVHVEDELQLAERSEAIEWQAK
jgi:hypothetical protein